MERSLTLLSVEPLSLGIGFSLEGRLFLQTKYKNPITDLKQACGQILCYTVNTKYLKYLNNSKNTTHA